MKNPRAFPSVIGNIEFGMTLRDYFAAKAMQVLFDDYNSSDVPEMAYRVADKMLLEREKGQQ